MSLDVHGRGSGGGGSGREFLVCIGTLQVRVIVIHSGSTIANRRLLFSLQKSQKLF
jgi:hypothetical protein